MSISDYIKILTSKNAVSGFEHEVSDYLCSHLESLCDDVFVDALGNVIAHKKSANSSGSVMLEAHIDEIGMIVKSIDDNGFLLVAPVGGIDVRILPALVVNVHKDKNYPGVIGAKPPHMTTSDESSKTIDFDKIYIDVGMSKEEADEKIGVGAFVTFDAPAYVMQNGHIASKCLDDRASAAVLLDCIDRLCGVDLGYDLYVCFCVQEEVGLRGSLGAAYSVNPSFAIALDVTHAQTPDETKGTFKCGVGPVVCLGPNIHKKLVNNFINHIKSQEIAYEIEVEGGNTGTDAWSIQTAREGIPTMLLSLPLKYMHTPVETMTVSDCEKTSDALVSFLKSFKKTEDVLC